MTRLALAAAFLTAPVHTLALIAGVLAFSAVWSRRPRPVSDDVRRMAVDWAIANAALRVEQDLWKAAKRMRLNRAEIVAFPQWRAA